MASGIIPDPPLPDSINIVQNNTLHLPDQLKLVQINLQKCRAASNNLVSFISQHKIQLACVQDPYSLNSHLIGFPSSWSIFHSDTYNSAVIVTNPKLKVIQTLKTPNSIFVSVQSRTQSLILGSFYSEPSQNFDDHLDQWLPHMQDQSFILTGDFNAKSPIWGSSRSDVRGNKILDLCSANDWVVMNNPSQPPTYYSTSGIGYPDLTICSSDMTQYVLDWTVHETDSLSDHRLITFTIVFSPSYSHRIHYKTKYGKLGFFLNKTRLLLNNLNSQIHHIHTTDQVDQFIKNFYSSLTPICDRSFRKKAYNRDIKITWYTPALRSQRNKLKALYRRLKLDRNDSLKIKYNREKSAINE